MSEVKFTPGPWKVGQDWRDIEAANGVLVVFGTASHGSGVTLPANAHLIAAAPALFDACADVWAALADTTDPALQRIASDCREALATALGDDGVSEGRTR